MRAGAGEGGGAVCGERAGEPKAAAPSHRARRVGTRRRATTSRSATLAIRSGRRKVGRFHAQSTGEEPAMLFRRPQYGPSLRLPPRRLGWLMAVLGILLFTLPGPRTRAGRAPNGHIAFESDIPSGTVLQRHLHDCAGRVRFRPVFDDPSQDLTISEYSPDGRWVLVNRRQCRYLQGAARSSPCVTTGCSSRMRISSCSMTPCSRGISPAFTAHATGGASIRSTDRGSRSRGSIRSTLTSTASG